MPNLNGNGFLVIAVQTDEAIPIQDAYIIVKNTQGTVLFDGYTDANGQTETFTLPAPDKTLTLDKNYKEPAYSKYTVDISKAGFIAEHVNGVTIVDTVKSILPVLMYPQEGSARQTGVQTQTAAILQNIQTRIPMLKKYLPPLNQNVKINDTTIDPVTGDINIDIPDVGLLIPNAYAQQAGSNVSSIREVVIPEYITVHLGIPTNSAVRNVRVKFPDYIKNVVSSEIYPTWPTSSLLANIHAITTFALNRIYTEWYTSRGFNFDITNSTAYDQYFVDGRNIYENISQLVDEYFNTYVRRFGFRNPFFTQYCNGTTSTCAGMSQWGTVDLANLGYSPIQILRYYYPNDIEIVATDNIQSVTQTYPGYALRNGYSGDAVLLMQNYLNRIRINFPLIPQISNPDGIFGAETEAAVRAFQRTFNLTPDGIIGKATWNKITFIYVGVIKLAELNSEGERITIGMNPPTSVLRVGSKGADVLELQFIINSISPYFPTIPTVINDSNFGNTTKNAVIEFQKTFNMTPDGVVGPATWNKLYSVYRGIEDNVTVPPAPPPPPENAPPYPGTPLRLGSQGVDVRTMQTYLNTIRIVYNVIPPLVVDGSFGVATQAAVRAFQQQFMLSPDGIIGPITWNKIVEMFLLVTGNTSVSTEYPGYILRVGSTGSNVRLMQNFLIELRTINPTLPLITADGIFGPRTQAAVYAFQKMFGLTQDGIIGPNTWNAIVSERNRHFGVQ